MGWVLFFAYVVVAVAAGMSYWPHEYERTHERLKRRWPFLKPEPEFIDVVPKVFFLSAFWPVVLLAWALKRSVEKGGTDGHREAEGTDSDRAGGETEEDPEGDTEEGQGEATSVTSADIAAIHSFLGTRQREPEPEPQEEELSSYEMVPDSITPLVGYRAWGLETRYGFLVGTGMYGGVWKPGEHDAKCRAQGARTQYPYLTFSPTSVVPHDDSHTPHSKCGCGFYSYRDPWDALYQAMGLEGRGVVGAVRLWGKIVPGDNGYRAQHAEPIALVRPLGFDDELAEALERRYGIVWCSTLAELERTAEAHAERVS